MPSHLWVLEIIGKKKPLLIRRKGQSRYDGLFSSGGLDDIIRQVGTNFIFLLQAN